MHTRTLIGGGGVYYSYLQALPTNFFLKELLLELITKQNSRTEQWYLTVIQRTRVVYELIADEVQRISSAISLIYDESE